MDWSCARERFDGAFARTKRKPKAPNEAATSRNEQARGMFGHVGVRSGLSMAAARDRPVRKRAVAAAGLRASDVPTHGHAALSPILSINSTFVEGSTSSTEGRSSQAVCANRSACAPAFRRYRVGGMPFRRSRAVRQLASKSSDLGGCADCAVECCEGATRRSRALQALTTMYELSFPRLRGDARDRHRKQCQLTCVRS